MTTVFKIYPVGFAANSYILTADGKNAVAIDPAQPRILGEAEKRGLSVRYVLLTHGHYDHIGGVSALYRAGAEVGCSEREKPLVFGGDNLASRHGITVPPFSVSFAVNDGEELELCGIRFRVIFTPGHTAGSVCYLTERSLFTGDTLFEGSVGRCDFPTGSGERLRESLKKLCALDGDCLVYAGHGEDTTLARERKYNPYLVL